MTLVLAVLCGVWCGVVLATFRIRIVPALSLFVALFSAVSGLPIAGVLFAAFTAVVIPRLGTDRPVFAEIVLGSAVCAALIIGPKIAMRIHDICGPNNLPTQIAVRSVFVVAALVRRREFRTRRAPGMWTLSFAWLVIGGCSLLLVADGRGE